MRHQKKGKSLNRNTHQRKALFRSLIQSLIIHEEIQTTESKAKAIRGLVERLITKAKVGSLNIRRQIQAFLPSKKVTNKLVDEIAPRFKQKSSGFTRLIKLGQRRGDNAPIVKMELVEKGKKKEAEAKEKKSGKTKETKEIRAKKVK
jgi:large subunit ribosomal protein L17